MKKTFLYINLFFTFHFSLFTLHSEASSGPLLYGMTQGGGTNSLGNIFKIYTDGTQFRTVYSFNGAQGSNPVGSLLQSYSNSKFYGMTLTGGTNNLGVIFSFEPYDSIYTVLVTFNGSNGSSPTGSIIEATNGLLYGMTPLGGSNNKGVLFSLDPVSNNYRVLYNFDSTHGSFPQGSIMQAYNGILYGMTQQGGSGNYGTVFTYTIADSVLNTIINFSGQYGSFKGANPSGSLVQIGDSTICGMTEMGGNANVGVIFSLNALNNSYAVLWIFATQDSHYPYGSLCVVNDSSLYGLTSGGTLSGSVFMIDPRTPFSMPPPITFGNGEKPHGSMILSGNGSLYFQTYGGGTSGKGQVMEFDPVNYTIATLHSFNGSDGLNPLGDVTIQRCAIPSFQTDTLGNCHSLTTHFLNLSTYSSSFLWNFGDGNSSDSTNPVHTYGFNSIDTVTLIATNNEGCVDTLKRVYHFLPNPSIASVTANDTSGCPVLTVYFHNNSTNSTSYQWYFGDGGSSTSSADSVGHNYTYSGFYDVRLYTHDSNTGCNDTLVLHSYIHVLPAPPVYAAFTMDTNKGCTPLTITFTNISDSTATSWEWYFGDSDSSSAYSPVYTYPLNTNDTMYPTLVVYNVDTAYPCVSRSVMRDTIIQHPSAQAHFTADSVSGCLPLNVHFTNLSSNAIGYYWDFGDGDTSNIANPLHTYTTAGNFTDTMIAYGIAGCNDTSISVNYIATQVRPNLISSFSGSPLSGCDSLEVQFSNTSNDAAFYFWKFGDGNTNSITNPGNYYTHPGNYSVTLIAYNPTLCGLLIDTLILHNYITVFPPPNIIITQSNDTLTSNFPTGNQWFDYGIPISGANSQQYIANTTGCYQTTYTDTNGCSNISNMICVDYAGINEITATNGITVYPNPLSDKATIIIDGKINYSNTSFVIYNLLGQELQRIELPAIQGKKELSIDRTDIPNGIYFYKIFNGNSEIISTGKLIFM